MADCEKNNWNTSVRAQQERDCAFILDFNESLIKRLILKCGKNLGNPESLSAAGNCPNVKEREC